MEDEIHIFCAPLDLPSARLRQLAETLSADERIRAAHFQFDQDRNRFMAGRGLLREILGWLLRLPPAALIFSYGAHGKPQLAAAPADRWLHFNLAHSDSLAVYAVSCSFEVGVDVERIRHIPEAGQIAAQFFTRSEAAHWRALPPAQQSEFFSDCWTCKEAYLKAIGMG
ncbi:MAG: 4'-phosphopantetheinyl transferase family protein, partial [Limisphaerales bacterium]